MSRVYKLTEARMAQAFANADNLFCCYPKGKQYKRVLNIHYVMGQDGNGSFDFQGPEQLDPTDLRVFQGVVALACIDFYRVGIVEMMREAGKHKNRLILTGDAIDQILFAVRFKLSDFAQEIGYARPSADTLERIRNSLARLGRVIVRAERPNFLGKPFQGSYQMLSGYWEDSATRDVVVVLNPELTASVWRKKSFLKMDMREIRALKSDAAHLLHHRLHWINGVALRVWRCTCCA